MVEGAVADIGSKIVQKIFSGILIFGVIAIILGVLIGVGYYYLVYKKKFNIKVKVVSERAEDKSSIFFDKAAILTDKKSGAKFLRLWDTKVELPAPKFNIFQTVGGQDYFELYRTAQNIFYYLTPSKIDKQTILKSDGKLYPVADQQNKMIDPEMDYWMLKRKTMNKGMVSTDSMFLKLLPYIPAILGGMITIFVLWVLMSHLPGILAQLTELARTLNEQSRGFAAG